MDYARQRVGCLVLLLDFVEQLAPHWPEIDADPLPEVLENLVDDENFLRRTESALVAGGGLSR